MKTAKEMFEELGYKYYEYDNSIEYYNDGHEIVFKKENKCIISRKTPNYDDPIYISKKMFYISMQLLQAINKQVEELGWNEEEI